MSTYKSYITGFALSILLVILAYIPVHMHLISQHEWPPHTFIIPVILILAMVQVLVQLKFFLHMGKKSGSGLNFPVLISTVGIMILLVAGSIWIMNHLNADMTPQQMQDYMKDQGSF
jgi:cytochrome o ubiquinol oxidase operon protein cyoD